ncbi:MAG: hypothetical protein M3R36_17305 [Bacteroidota bacterium]|nr:hypothetical protein [Bacteroidota bacterium]
MIYTSIVFFSLAAILGMVLLSFILSNKATPKAIVFTHGPLAAVGLILLIIYTVNSTAGSIESVILFVMAL